MLCLPIGTASVFPCFCIFPAMPLNIPSVDLTRSQVYHNGDLKLQRSHEQPDLPHRKGTFPMLTEVIKSTEANMTTNRRFYEEVINQKRLAVVDEVAGANYQPPAPREENEHGGEPENHRTEPGMRHPLAKEPEEGKVQGRGQKQPACESFDQRCGWSKMRHRRSNVSKSQQAKHETRPASAPAYLPQENGQPQRACSIYSIPNLFFLLACRRS